MPTKQPLKGGMPDQLALAFCVGLCCTLLVVIRPSLLNYLNDKSFDRMVARARQHPPTQQTTVVDIDEYSLAKVGRWPWPRDVIALLVKKLEAEGPAVIAVDIVFPEHDASTKKDSALAASLGQSRSVVGFDFLFDSNHERAAPCPVPPKPLFGKDRVSGYTYLSLQKASAVICDIPELAAPIIRAGFVNSARDRDGILRRVPLLMAYQEGIYPSFALAAVLSASPQDAVEYVKASAGGMSLGWQGRRIQLSEDGDLLLRYRGRDRPLPHYSAANVLGGNVPSEPFREKIVVIGNSTHALEESAEARAELAFPSVEVQATAIDNLIAGDYFYQPAWGLLCEIASIFATAILSALLLFRTYPAVGVCGSVVVAFLGWMFCQTMLSGWGAFVSPIPALFAWFGTLGVWIIAILFKAGTVGRRSREEVVVANRFVSGALGAMTAVRDVETGQHVVRIQSYLRSLCEVMARRPGFGSYLTPQMIDLLVQLAPIHDIGKVGMPDHILRKPSALTAAEFEHMKSHVTLGKQILEEARQRSGLQNEIFFQTAKDIVYSHHERWDGSGYPLGLKGDAIPIPGRLLAVADVYDALISKRHYKSEFLHAEAVEKIRQGSGSHFDPQIVEGFMEVQDDWRRMAEEHRDEPGFAASAT